MLRDYKRSLFESDVAEVSPSNVQFIAPLANPPLQLQPGAVLVPPALPAANALFPTAPKLQQSPFTQRAQSIDDTMMVSYNDQQYPPYRPSIPLNRGQVYQCPNHHQHLSNNLNPLMLLQVIQCLP